MLEFTYDESNTNVISEKTIALVSKHLVNELDITKLRHFGSDGAATMTGIRNGVATQLKKLNNFITSTHCVAHRLHLASEEAANETPYFAHYKTIIKGIYSYFSNSYK
ncbi:uncharacterized protein OCT59_021824 [Rhizophagus irregularis]|uniref:uncharacterized protein n=1 Tax=Rhizophagus irregularis TaxID=588596 RepID=UPI0033207261|nr:hypothetical protein OCT59_021824 [Rhizophagus irregularis]